MQNQDVNAVIRRTKQYWYEDGFSDLAMGAFLLLLGLMFAAEALTPQGSPLWVVWSFGWPIILIGGGLLVNWAVKELKTRYTFPRTGYASYECRERSRTVQFLGVFLLSALISAGIVIISRGFENLTLLFGVVFAAAFGFVGYRIGLVRYMVLAIISLVTGLALLPLGLDLETGGALFFGVVGAAMLVSGAVVARKYMAQTREA